MTDQTLLIQAEQIIAEGGFPVLRHADTSEQDEAGYVVLPYQKLVIGQDTKLDPVNGSVRLVPVYPSEIHQGAEIGLGFSVPDSDLQYVRDAQRGDARVQGFAAFVFAASMAASVAGASYLGDKIEEAPSSPAAAQDTKDEARFRDGLTYFAAPASGVLSLLFAISLRGTRRELAHTEDAVRTREYITDQAAQRAIVSFDALPRIK